MASEQMEAECASCSTCLHWISADESGRMRMERLSRDGARTCECRHN